jgi:chaperone required for assembly of F1-ATPase
MQRFYREVDIAPSDNGYSIRLDGKPVRTPTKALLEVPTRGLAEAVASEWRSQDDKIKPQTMHLTQLANTALDRVAVLRGWVVDTVLAYAETDLVCHRADHPIELVRRQQLVWQPVLDWLVETYDAPLRVTCGILPVRQPDSSLATLRGVVSGLDTHKLTALNHATSLLGSLVLALAMLAGRLDDEEAFEASLLDETFQIERWGEDAESAARRAAIRQELAATCTFARLLAGPPPAR